MHPFFHRPKVRRVRTIFRWCRIILWSILLLVVSAIAYLHLVGLPDFLKKPLLRRLLAQGVAAQFSNMQLGWWKGPSIILENASFSRSHQPLSPRMTTGRAELALNWHSLVHSQIAPRSLQILEAQLRLPVSETNGDALVIKNVVMDVRFFSNDIAKIDLCRGMFHGVQIDVLGGMSHVSMLHHWKFPLGGGATNVAMQNKLRNVAQTLEKIQFAGTPLLQVEVGADGEDMNSFHAEMNFATAGARTPWGQAANVTLEMAVAKLVKPGTDPFLRMKWNASEMDTPWGRGRHVLCTANFSHNANSNLDTDSRFESAQFNVPLDSTGSNWFSADRFTWIGAATLASSNLAPLLATGQLHAAGSKTPWGSARDLLMEGHAERGRETPPSVTNWGWWANIAPWTFNCRTDLRDLVSPKLRVDHADFSARWSAPKLVVQDVNGNLYSGHVTAEGSLDVDTRELHCGGSADFNPHGVMGLFRTQVRNWVAQLAWTNPPKLNLQMRIVLPPWTHRPPNWSSDVDSSLQFAGDFTVGPGSFRGVPIQSTAGLVTYTNRTWNVSRLRAVPPDGVVDLDFISDERSGKYQFIIDSHLEPGAALPLLTQEHRHLLDDFTFTAAPEIHANVRGRWGGSGASEHTGCDGTVRATNFTFRGEPVAAFNAGVHYTNLVLDVRDFFVSNGQCQASSSWSQIDFRTKMVRLTNGIGTLDPELLKRVLRDNPPDFLNHLHFAAPPAIAVSGSFSFTNSDLVNLRFSINSKGVQYTNLAAENASVEVDWTGQVITLTNLATSLYNGSLTGWVVFDSSPARGADFRADLTARDIDLYVLARGLAGKITHVEGQLDGHLHVEGPNNLDRSDWQGYGHIHAHDALLWDLKLFGLLSPVLNAISPGWGHSRAREATANFTITNGTVASDDMNVRCTGFLMKLRGTVDKNQRIKARFEADLSREMPVFGPVISMMFTPLSKLFEYRITGPLRDPVMEPIYVPKFVLLMLHPFHTLKTIATPASSRPTDDAK